MGNRLKALLLSDFNLGNFSNILNNDNNDPLIETISAPYDQLYQILSNNNNHYWGCSYDFGVFWAQPTKISSEFFKLLSAEDASVEKIYQQTDEYCDFISKKANYFQALFIPLLTLPTFHSNFSLIDMNPPSGLSYVLMKMNLRIIENLSNLNNFHILNTQKWIEKAGSNAFDPKLWYMAKIPFSSDVFYQASNDIKSCLISLKGGAKKIILLDLDDTLWGGTIGDVGWENIRLGGHDPVGEAFVDFQHALKTLKKRGILLGIVSKNTEELAIEAFEKHKEMVLKKNDFIAWRINWDDKATNIVDLIDEINIGMNSVVFIDDNPVERARVRDALPEVFVPDWPQDKMMYKSALFGLPSFNIPSINEEDNKRTNSYHSEQERKKLKKTVGSAEDWIKKLKINIIVESIDNSNIKRITQLLNKTNQMNLSTRRLIEDDLMSWVNKANNYFWAFRVSDIYGDSGLTGLTSISVSDGIGKIDDFVLSCRVMGRNVEEAMLSVIIKHAQQNGVEKIIAEYIPTKANNPCYRFFSKSGMDSNGNQFTWKGTKKFKKPSHINIIDNT